MTQKDLENKDVLTQEEQDFSITAKKIIEIPEGKHLGYVHNVCLSEPERQFDYIDIYFKITDVEGEPDIKFGVPANLSELSKLGRLLMQIGFNVEAEKEYKFADMKKALIGKEASFKTINVEDATLKVEFARIIDDTVNFIN